jgi:hypothetical protein
MVPKNISIPTKNFLCLYKLVQADKSPNSVTLNQLGQISHKFGPDFHFLLTSLKILCEPFRASALVP